MCVSLLVNYPLFFTEFNATLILATGFIFFSKNYSIVKFYEIAQWDLAVPCGCKDTDRRDVQTGTAKLIATFSNFANEPEERA
jgi:hypothetical protein